MWVRNPLRKDKKEKRKISRFTDAIQWRNRGYLMLFKFLSFFSESSVFVTFAKKKRDYDLVCIKNTIYSESKYYKKIFVKENFL